MQKGTNSCLIDEILLLLSVGSDIPAALYLGLCTVVCCTHFTKRIFCAPDISRQPRRCIVLSV